MSPFPNRLVDFFKPSTYSKWYHMLWGIPFFLGLIAFWHLVVLPWRRIKGMLK